MPIINGTKINKSLIPKGTDSNSINVRRGIVTTIMSQYKGRKIFCPALNRYVEFNQTSIKETVAHASKRYDSTLLVMNLTNAIQTAQFERSDIPKSKNQKKEKFKIIHILKGRLKKTGSYKLSIGEKSSKRIFHYCITENKKSKK